MRHCAVLFWMLGLFVFVAAFTPALQLHASTAGLLSVGSFLWLAWSVGDDGPQIRRVVVADIIALLCLVSAIAIRVAVHRRASEMRLRVDRATRHRSTRLLRHERAR